jgi:hypothetical protein
MMNRPLTILIIGLLIGGAIGAILTRFITQPLKIISTISYTTLYSTVTETTHTPEKALVTVTQKLTETKYLTQMETKTITTVLTKTYRGEPIFSISKVNDPYIDFYVIYYGEVFVSKARTQLWDYRIIPGDEINYVHLLVGYLVNEEWHFAEGFEDEVKTDLVSSNGRYLEWISHVHEYKHDFDSKAHVRIFTINGYIVIEVQATLTPNKDFNNVVDLYVEFGRKSGGFKWTAVKTNKGIIKQDMIYTGEEKYVAHYFEELKIPRYGWIAGRTLDEKSTLVLVFKSAEITIPEGTVIEMNEIRPSALDTAGHYDTIELHMEREPPENLKTGYIYRLNYYILVSQEEGYDWIENLISFINN